MGKVAATRSMTHETLLAVCICLLVVAGCGDDDSPRRPAATPSATVAPPTKPATATPILSPTTGSSPTLTVNPTATPTPSPSATSTETSTPTFTTTPTVTPTSTPTTFMLLAVNAAPESAPAGHELPEPLTIRVTDGGGAGLADVEVEFTVPLGGGTVEPQRIRTGPDGSASVRWTLGVVPVANRLRADVGDLSVRFNARATLDAPYVPEPFANVNEFMMEQAIDGSTEDLSFESNRIVLGVPGGLLEVDAQGVTSAIQLEGDALVNPLGVAFDQQGNLWVADSQGPALRRVSPAGEVTTVLTDDGTQPLSAPNYVDVDAAGRIYLSDPCLGELLRYDPMAGRVDAVLTFDLPNDGGPNGFAFDEAGENLYIATENTALFCGHTNVGLTDVIAGLFSVPVSDTGFGEREDIVTRFALFGDGVAFDREGNLYAIFDTQANFMLEESAVWVLPAGETTLVKLLSVHDRVLANLAFGRGDFGNTTLYIALLAVPPFTTPEARGLERFETGIRGLRVPPLP